MYLLRLLFLDFLSLLGAGPSYICISFTPALARVCQFTTIWEWDILIFVLVEKKFHTICFDHISPPPIPLKSSLPP